MPTGYTAGIADGMEFKDFVLGCARAFGALVELRDEPSDAEIPDEFKPNLYYQERVEEAKQNLLELESITLLQAEHNAMRDYNSEVDRIEKRKQEMVILEKKYRKMLVQVGAWEPPTTNYEGLKKFMVDQIECSIEQDCFGMNFNDPKLLTGEEWLASKRGWLERDIRYYKEQYEKDVERANNRTEWVQALKKSL